MTLAITMILMMNVVMATDMKMIMLVDVALAISMPAITAGHYCCDS